MRTAGIARVFAVLGVITLASCSPFTKYRVPTAGMEPTIVIGEEFMADEHAYDTTRPRPGDVVVFHSPANRSNVVASRCVAEGGQVVEIRAGVLYVNSGVFDTTIPLTRNNPRIRPPEFKEPMIFPRGAGNIDYYGPVTVPEGTYFVLGDDRDYSLDSRYFGFVDRSLVRGKAVRISASKCISRVGTLIH